MAGLNHAKMLLETARVHNRCELSNFLTVARVGISASKTQNITFIFRVSKCNCTSPNVIAHIVKNIYLDRNDKSINGRNVISLYLTNVFIA